MAGAKKLSLLTAPILGLTLISTVVVLVSFFRHGWISVYLLLVAVGPLVCFLFPVSVPLL